MNAYKTTKYISNILDIDLEDLFLDGDIPNVNFSKKEREKIFKMFDENKFLIDYRGSHNESLYALILITYIINYIERNVKQSIEQIKYNDKMEETLNLYKKLLEALINLKREVDNLYTHIIDLDIENVDTFGDGVPYTISLYNKENNNEYIRSFLGKNHSKGGKKKIRTKRKIRRVVSKRKSKRIKFMK
jgi:hypothetical protein